MSRLRAVTIDNVRNLTDNDVLYIKGGHGPLKICGMIKVWRRWGKTHVRLHLQHKWNIKIYYTFKEDVLDQLIVQER